MSYSKLTDAIGNCIGYGHMDAEFYFFGLEEKSQAGNVDYSNLYLEHHDIAKGFYAIPNDKFPDESKIIKGNSIYKTYLHFYKHLNNTTIDISEFLSDKTPIFIGNVYPFSKDKNSHKYTNALQEWIALNIDERIKYVFSFLAEKSRAKKVFTFGSKAEFKKEFEKLGLKFEVQNFEPIPLKKQKQFFKCNNRNLYLLDHTSWGHLSNKNKEEFLEWISKQKQ